MNSQFKTLEKSFPGPSGFTWDSTKSLKNLKKKKFKELIPVLYNLFKKIEEVTSPGSFYEVTVTLIPEKDSTKTADQNFSWIQMQKSFKKF